EEGFDNAALEANFEQKLDDKIANLQPEWTQFKEDTTAQLADTDRARHFESMINRKKPRQPMIAIDDDDGFLGFYTVLFDLAKEYNIPMTSAMITSRAMSFPGDGRPQRPQNYNYEQIMEMKNSGLIEFVSHSHNHERLSELSEEEIRDDLR